MNSPIILKINKTKVALYPIKEVRTVIINVLIKAGSWYETGGNWGAFHLLEHMMFQGTKNLSNYEKIEKFKYDNAVNFNGSSGGKNMNFWFKFPYIKLNQGLFLMEEILFNPVIPKEKLNREISVIKQEFEDKWDNPRNRFGQAFDQNLFGKNHIFCRDGLGQPDYLNKITSEDLLNLHSKYFQPQNMVLSIVGNFDPKKISSKLKNIFSKYKNSFNPKIKNNKIKTNQKKFIHYDNVNQAYLIIDWPIFKKYSLEERYAINIGSFLIGSDTNSILNKKIREELGLVYNINSSFITHPNLTIFEIYSSANIKNINKITNLIQIEIEKFLNQKIDKNKFQQVKNYMNFQTLMCQDSITNISQDLVGDLFWEGKVFTPENRIKIAENITLKKVQNIFQEIISKKKMVIGVMLPKN